MLAALNLLAAGENNNMTWIWIVFIVLVLVVMFVMPMISNRKRQKEANEVYDALRVGDEVLTAGGILGRVIGLSTHASGEKLMIIETGEGDNKTTLTVSIRVLAINYTGNARKQAEIAAKTQEKDKKRHEAEDKDEAALEEAKSEEEKSEETETEEKSEETEEVTEKPEESDRQDSQQ